MWPIALVLAEVILTLPSTARAGAEPAFEPVPGPAASPGAYAPSATGAYAPSAPRAYAPSAPRAEPDKQRHKARPIVPFPEDLVAARKDARERNVPMLVLMALEGEEASDRFRNALLPDLVLARACERALVLFTNNGIHETVTVTEVVDGHEETRVVCALYKTPSCTIHQRVWDQVFFEFNREGEIELPHVLVLNPDGSLFRRISTRDVPSVDTIVEAVEDAREAAGPGLTTDELRALRGALLPARKNAELKSWAKAWRLWLEVASIAPDGPYEAEATRGIEAAEKGVREELAYALAKLVPGQAARGYELLLELRVEVEGLPLAKELDERIRDAERDKQLKEEIRIYKVEREARALLDEAYALVAADEERKAERIVRKLLKNKRLAETEAAQKARTDFPQWVEEDS